MGKNIVIVILVAVVLGLSVATGIFVNTNSNLEGHNAQLQTVVADLEGKVIATKNEALRFRSKAIGWQHGFEVRHAEATCYYTKVKQTGFNLEKCLEENVSPNLVRLSVGTGP